MSRGCNGPLRTIIFILCINYSGASDMVDVLKNWGPAITVFSEFEICKGPKRNNLTIINLEMVLDDKNQSNIVGNYTLDKTTANVTANLQVFQLEKNVFKRLTSITESNICAPLYGYILTILKNIAEFDSKICAVKKANSKVINFNLYNFFYAIFKAKGFYGLFKYKIQAYTPSGNLFCVTYQLRNTKPNVLT